MRVAEYLSSCGATDVKEVRPFLWQFRLPGDQAPAGRVTTTRDGIARIWHRGAREGLILSDKWTPSAPIDLGEGRSVPSYTAKLSDLGPGERIEKKPLSYARVSAPDAQVKEAALGLLLSYGWKLAGKSPAGMLYLNDGTGTSPACRLAVHDGVATVWSFRGDVDLPPPWRQGRPLATGEATMYVTARDLGIDSGVVVHSPPPPSLLPAPRYDAVDKELSASVVKWWKNGSPAPADHRHLTKSGALLQGDDLMLFPDDSPYKGDLIVPMFRPASEDAQVAVEISGAQRLCGKVMMNTDKMLLPGTKLFGSFVPIPFSPLMDQAERGVMNFEQWIKALEGEEKKRPLVVCEGVATALAIYESGAGIPVAAISSGNIPAVAKWLSESGYAQRFNGFVIAADYDVSMRNGVATSKAIQRAIEAAEQTGARIAIPPAGSPSGTDARDLYAQGAQAVRDYIVSAVEPSVARAAPDIAPVLVRRDLGVER